MSHIGHPHRPRIAAKIRRLASAHGWEVREAAQSGFRALFGGQVYEEGDSWEITLERYSAALARDIGISCTFERNNGRWRNIERVIYAYRIGEYHTGEFALPRLKDVTQALAEFEKLEGLASLAGTASEERGWAKCDRADGYRPDHERLRV